MQQADTQSEKPSHTEDTEITMTASWKQPLIQILLILVSCRHINTTSAGPTPPPSVSIPPLITASAEQKDETDTKTIELGQPVNITLKCTWTGSRNKLPNITGYWQKDGQEIQNSQITVELEDDGYNLKQAFIIQSEKDLGNYSCVFGNEAKMFFVLTVPQIGEKRDKPIVSYLRDFVVMTCKIDENKPKPDTWNWFRDNGTDKVQIIADAMPEHYEFEKKTAKKTKLKVKGVSEEDSGIYYCGAVYSIGTSISRMELTVISYMEPLKPFLCILAEVVVLVAAILLYEKRQSKKSDTEENGTNVDRRSGESQGDNKGAEESTSVRQRKA